MSRPPDSDHERKRRFLALWALARQGKAGREAAAEKRKLWAKSARVAFSPKPEMEVADWPEAPPSRKSRRTHLALSVVGGLLAIAIVGSLVWWLYRTQPASPRDRASLTEEAGSPPAPVDNEAVLDGISQALSGFLRATSAEEQLAFCREPTRVAPALREFWTRRPQTPDTGGELNLVAKRRTAGWDHFVASVTTSARERRQFALFEGPPGTFRVDWETAVAYNPMDWDQFLSSRPTNPRVFRVYATLSDYYNHQFEDRRRWTSVELRPPSGQRLAHGYADSATRGWARLSALLKGKREAPVMLALRFPGEKGNAPQVLIDSLENDTWLIPPMQTKH